MQRAMVKCLSIELRSDNANLEDIEIVAKKALKKAVQLAEKLAAAADEDTSPIIEECQEETEESINALKTIMKSCQDRK
jgi:hypothetical protein